MKKQKPKLSINKIVKEEEKMYKDDDEFKTQLIDKLEKSLVNLFVNNLF